MRSVSEISRDIPQTFRQLGNAFYQGYHYGWTSRVAADEATILNFLPEPGDRREVVAFIDELLRTDISEVELAALWRRVNDQIGVEGSHRVFFKLLSSKVTKTLE